MNGSRTTNTSANVSPSLNDNNSRTVLLGSDDIRTPSHHHNHHNHHAGRHRQRSTQVHTDSTNDYDDVASHSTVDDSTPQTSSENASISEVPFDSRFKTFVKQKKNKSSSNPTGINATTNKVAAAAATTTGAITEHYDRRLPPAPCSEDTDNEPSTNLLSEHYADALPVRTNGSSQRGTHFAGKGGDSYHRISTSGNSANQNGISGAENDNDYDLNEGGSGENDKRNDRVRRKRHDQEDESDDSPDEDDEDAEEGVYDLGTSNLFLD